MPVLPSVTLRRTTLRAMSKRDQPSSSFMRVAVPWVVLLGAVAIVTAFALDLDEPTPRRQSAPLASNAASTTASGAIGATQVAPRTPTVVTPPSPTALASTVIEPKELDYGTLKPGEVKTLSGIIRNTGVIPIEFTGQMKGCSCTTVDIPKGIVQPGESIGYSATLTAGLTPTTKKSSISLVLANHQPVRIPVDGEIIRGIRVSPRRINAVSIDPTQPDLRVPAQIRRVQLQSPTNTPFRILRIDGRPVEEFPGGSRMLNPVPQHSFIFDDFSEYDAVTGLSADGDMLPFFRLIETDHPGAAVVEIPVDHPARIAQLERRGQRPWMFVENRVVVPAVEPGGVAIFELPVKVIGSANGERVVAVTSESPELFEAELLSVRNEGREWRVRFKIVPLQRHDGAFLGKVRLHSSKFSAPLPIIGAVQRAGPPA